MRAQPQRWRAAGAASLACLLLIGCSPAAPVTSRVPGGVIPAKLAVVAPAGAEIHIDGVLVGEAPLASEILADPGPHVVGVVLDGHAPAVERVSLERGKTRALEVELSTTAQRKAAWVLIAFGGAGVAGGIVLGALAVVEQRRADDLVQGGFGSAAPPDLEEFSEASDARDRYRVGSGVSVGTGIALFVTGALLYAFDEAALPAGRAERSGLRFLPLSASAGLGAVPGFQLQW